MVRSILYLCFFIIVLNSTFIYEAFAEDKPQEEAKPFWKWDKMTGDWGGYRTKWEEENGLSFEFTYTGDVLSNAQRWIASS